MGRGHGTLGARAYRGRQTRGLHIKVRNKWCTACERQERACPIYMPDSFETSSTMTFFGVLTNGGVHEVHRGLGRQQRHRRAGRKVRTGRGEEARGRGRLQACPTERF